MADPFVAEIRMFPFNFPPTGWAWCDGQILPISQNTALFSLLGTTYGGDGKSTFSLPNLQGSCAIAPGQGPGLSLRDLGEIGGSQSVTLLQTEIPAHTHTFSTGLRPSDSVNPGGVASGTGNNMYVTASDAMMQVAAPQALASAGGSLPHNNMQPYLTLYFNIALQGVFPPRG
jgi:microcystin-dependent protein